MYINKASKINIDPNKEIRILSKAKLNIIVELTKPTHNHRDCLYKNKRRFHTVSNEKDQYKAITNKRKRV